MKIITLTVFCILLLSGCTMAHVYNRKSTTENVYIYTEKEPTETYWGDSPIAEYSGINNVEIQDAFIHVRVKGYEQYEQYKAPLIHEKRITHYGPNPNSGFFILSTILLGGLPYIADPKIWLENLNGWDEEDKVNPKPDKRYAVKTGNTVWRSFILKKNITVEFSKFKKSLTTFTDNSDSSYSFLNEIVELDTTKPQEFIVICTDCSDTNSQPQLDKLFSVIEVQKDLAPVKNKILSQKKLDADEADKKEKEFQKLAKLQKEQSDPFNLAKGQCKDLGFKEKTEKFADCVLKLSSNTLVNSAPKESIKGDGSQDDKTCQKYGFRPGTSDYSDCRMKIDMAKQQSAQQQAQFQEQQEQYQAELKAYEERKQKEASLKLMQFGLGVLSGNGSRSQYSNYGAPPVAPAFVPSTQTYILPGGQHMNCTTTGSVTNCF